MTDDEVRRDLGIWIKNRRQDLRLSVREAARRAGIDRATWTGLEDGSRQTQDTKYAGIEDALEVAHGSIAARLRGEPVRRPEVGSEAWWDNLARKLPPADFWSVVEHAKMLKADIPRRLAQRWAEYTERDRDTHSRA